MLILTDSCGVIRRATASAVVALSGDGHSLAGRPLVELLPDFAAVLSRLRAAVSAAAAENAADTFLGFQHGGVTAYILPAADGEPAGFLVRVAGPDTPPAVGRPPWSDLFGSMPQIIVLLDHRHRIVRANDAAFRVLEIPVEELIGRKCCEVFHGSDHYAAHCPMEKLRESERPSTVDMEMEALGGWYRVICSPLMDEAGRLQYVLHVATEITDHKRAVSELQEARERYRSLVEASADAILLTDLEGRILMANREAAVMHGFSTSEEFLTHCPYAMDMVSPDDRERAITNMKRTFKDGLSRGQIYRLQRKDGSEFLAEVSASVVRDTNGRPVAFTAIGRDVSRRLQEQVERERLTEHLRETSQLLEAIFNAIPDVLGLQDRNHRIIRYNEAGYRFLGLRPEQAVGKKCYELIQRTHPCHVCATSDVYETKKTSQIEKYFPELDIWLDIRGYPILNDQGAVVQVIEHLRDITREKKAEKALRESEEKYRSIIENTLVGIYILQEETFRYGNQLLAEMFGFAAPRDMAGISVWDLVASEDRPRFQEFLRAPHRHQPPEMPFEFKGLRCNGSLFEAETLGTVIEFEGRPAVQGAIRDVSWERRLNEQLIQAQKMESIGRLAGGIAHDFNNILTGIIGTCELALTDLPKDSPLYPDLQEISSSAERAANLTRQLLATSRRQILKPKVVDLGMVVAAMEQMLRRTIGEDIVLIIRREDPEARIRVDPGQMEQVILNLVVNARDAMPDGGKIHIDIQPLVISEEDGGDYPGCAHGDYVVLTIQDTGVGMTDAVRHRIFEPFFTTKLPGKGTGLGLSTVYGIIRQSHGHIFVHSEPGAGTTFQVIFPRSMEATAPEQAVAADLRLLYGSERVLIIEDDEAVRRYAVRILEQLGYRVWSAPSGGEALRLCSLQAEPFDLILTDVVMPHLSGPEFGRQIRQHWPAVKVLFMSGYTRDDEGLAVRLDPEAPFLQKPFRPIQLAQKIREMLSK
ncbi:MAG: PAS domain S-box protein [Acidobacteria bacterium]|nr:PAS domain S-box protein [Acidobacteriota bacterium]